jgi:hypothetical protein
VQTGGTGRRSHRALGPPAQCGEGTARAFARRRLTTERRLREGRREAWVASPRRGARRYVLELGAARAPLRGRRRGQAPALGGTSLGAAASDGRTSLGGARPGEERGRRRPQGGRAQCKSRKGAWGAAGGRRPPRPMPPHQHLLRGARLCAGGGPSYQFTPRRRSGHEAHRGAVQSSAAPRGAGGPPPMIWQVRPARRGAARRLLASPAEAALRLGGLQKAPDALKGGVLLVRRGDKPGGRGRGKRGEEARMGAAAGAWAAAAAAAAAAPARRTARAPGAPALARRATAAAPARRAERPCPAPTHEAVALS